MNTNQLGDIFLNALNQIKSQLDSICDAISPHTGNQRLILVNDGNKICVDTGYNFNIELQNEENIDLLPDYIKNSKVIDKHGDIWFYVVIRHDDFILAPFKFDVENPNNVAIWSVTKLQLLIGEPTVDEMASSIKLDDDWFFTDMVYFSNFTDAYIAFIIITQSYSTPDYVN